MKHVLLKTFDDRPMARIYLDPPGHIRIEVINPTDRDDIDGLINEELEAGVTFTAENVERDASTRVVRQATVMKARAINDPLYLDGLAEGINLRPIALINNVPVQAELINN